MSKPASARLSLSEYAPLRLLRGWLQKLPLPSAANADGTAWQTTDHSLLQRAHQRNWPVEDSAMGPGA